MGGGRGDGVEGGATSASAGQNERTCQAISLGRRATAASKASGLARPRRASDRSRRISFRCSKYRLRRSLAISFLHAMNFSFVASVGGIVLLYAASYSGNALGSSICRRQSSALRPPQQPSSFAPRRSRARPSFNAVVIIILLPGSWAQAGPGSYASPRIRAIC